MDSLQQLQSSERIKREVAMHILKNATAGNPIAKTLGEEIGPTFVDSAFHEIPAYKRDYELFRGGTPRESTSLGKYYTTNMNKLFHEKITLTLKPLVDWMKDLLRQDSKRANKILFPKR